MSADVVAIERHLGAINDDVWLCRVAYQVVQRCWKCAEVVKPENGITEAVRWNLEYGRCDDSLLFLPHFPMFVCSDCPCGWLRASQCERTDDAGEQHLEIVSAKVDFRPQLQGWNDVPLRASALLTSLHWHHRWKVVLCITKSLSLSTPRFVHTHKLDARSTVTDWYHSHNGRPNWTAASWQPPDPHPSCTSSLPLLRCRSSRIHVVLCETPLSTMSLREETCAEIERSTNRLTAILVALPREEGWTRVARLEAPLGPLKHFGSVLASKVFWSCDCSLKKEE